MAQSFQSEAVDVADAGLWQAMDSRGVGVDDAVAIGDGDGVACDLVDGLQPVLELACKLLRRLLAALTAQDGEGRVLDARDGSVLARVAAQDARLLAHERAQEGRFVRILDILVKAALEQDQRVILLVHRIGLLVAGQVAEEALAVVQPRDGVLTGFAAIAHHASLYVERVDRVLLEVHDADMLEDAVEVAQMGVELALLREMFWNSTWTSRW